MSEQLPVVYLIVLVVLLSVSAFFVLREIIKARRIEGTLNRLQNKLKKESGTAKEYYELGSIYLDKKLYVQAIKLLQKSLKVENDLEPENRALVYNALGYAYFAQEQYDLAIRQYKEAIQCNPQYVTAFNNLGSTYERKQMTNKALETYEQALKYQPNNSTAKRRAESLRKRLVPTK
jgi:tetratricopeptide (TPR) repeat protein